MYSRTREAEMESKEMQYSQTKQIIEKMVQMRTIYFEVKNKRRQCER